jgi:hypothetical protein
VPRGASPGLAAAGVPPLRKLNRALLATPPTRSYQSLPRLTRSAALGLVWIAYLMGALSLLAGAIACEGAQSRRFSAQAIEALTGDRTPLTETRWLVLLVGLLFFAGGLALCALSRWAAPIFILGTLLATGYLLYASRVLPPTDAAQAQGRRRTITAIYLYAAATALVLWLESQGVLS